MGIEDKEYIMCEYCETGHWIQATNPDECTGLYVEKPGRESFSYLDYPPKGWSLSVYSDDAAGYYGEGGNIYYEIYFCPICGRKLD